MHNEVLDFMIANTCHNESIINKATGESKFTFDLHCVEVEVVARFIGDWLAGDIRYEIVSWESRAI